MPHDRRSRRILLATLGLVGMTMSVGCMRSSNLRTSAGPLPELSPVGEVHPVAGGSAPTGANPPSTTPAPNPGGSAAGPPEVAPAADRALTPASTSNPVVPAGAAPAAGGTGAVNDAAPAGGSSASPAPAGEAPGPSESSTPLLDAEIRRARAITRQHFESLSAVEASPPVTAPVNAPAARPANATIAEPVPADPDPDLIAPLPPLAASSRTVIEPGPAGSAARITLPTLTPVNASPPGSAAPSLLAPPQTVIADSQGPSPAPRPAASPAIPEGSPLTQTPADEKPDETDQPAAQPPRNPTGPSSSAEAGDAERPPLEIAALRLCSKVKGFGSFEAVNPDALRPGQFLRVYCEMAGVEYQPRGDVFVSRLAAHIELRSGTDGPVVWEQAPGTAEDVCPRRRRDYYVSYLVELPRTVQPGPYRLRLIQTDLVGNRAASSEMPVTVVGSQ